MENKIIIGIGKGRDGTTSLSKNLEKIIELNKSKVKVHHEKFVKDIYNNFHFHFNNKLKLQEKNNKILNKNILKSKIKSKIFKIGFNKEKFFRNKINNIYLLDKNNFKNIHFIYFICKKFKISDKIIFKSLNKYQGLKFRKQIIYYGKKLIIINDSKSTSFSSTVGLLSTYKNIYWIVGGKFKKGDKFTLNKKYYKNIRAYLIGLDNRKFLYQLKNKIKFIYLKNLKRALMKIKKDIKTDNKLKTILFSPAAASFDQFKNFEQRGYFFNIQTKKLLLNE